MPAMATGVSGRCSLCPLIMTFDNDAQQSAVGVKLQSPTGYLAKPSSSSMAPLIVVPPRIAGGIHCHMAPQYHRMTSRRRNWSVCMGDRLHWINVNQSKYRVQHSDSEGWHLPTTAGSDRLRWMCAFVRLAQITIYSLLFFARKWFVYLMDKKSILN